MVAPTDHFFDTLTAAGKPAAVLLCTYFTGSDQYCWL